MAVKVRERPKGSGIWWLFIDHRGRRKAQKIGRSKKAALDIARQVEAKLVLNELNLAPEEKAKVPTFKEYAETWADTYVKSLRRSTTHSRYKDLLKKHVYPVLGKKPIDEIKRGEVRDLIVKIHGKGFSKPMCQLIFTVINGPLSYAVEEQLIKENPVAGLTRRLELKVEKQVVDPMTFEDVNKFLNTCKSNFSFYYPFFLCAFRTGMRLGELLGLRWGDVDWNGRFIDVKRSYKKGKIGPTKTGRSRRVDMSDQLAAALKDIHDSRKVIDGPGESTATEIIFQRNGKPMEQGFIRRVFKTILTKAELKHRRVHEARHAFASHLLSQGVSPVYVKEQLGHTSIQMTVDIYGHLIPGSNREAVNLLDTRLSATHPQPAKTEKAQPLEIAPFIPNLEPMRRFELLT